SREPLSDDLGTRAEPLVREGLPRREVDDRRIGQDAREGTAQGLGVTAGRRDDEERTRFLRRTPGAEQAGDQGCPESVGDGEIRVTSGVAEGIVKSGGARKRID